MIKKRKFLRPDHWGPELSEDPIEAEDESQKFMDDSGAACGACLPTSRRQPSDALAAARVVRIVLGEID